MGLSFVNIETGEEFNLGKPCEELRSTCMEFQERFFKFIKGRNIDDSLKFTRMLYDLSILMEKPLHNFDAIRTFMLDFDYDFPIQYYFNVSTTKKTKTNELQEVRPELFQGPADFFRFLSFIQTVLRVNYGAMKKELTNRQLEGGSGTNSKPLAGKNPDKPSVKQFALLYHYLQEAGEEPFFENVPSKKEAIKKIAQKHKISPNTFTQHYNKVHTSWEERKKNTNDLNKVLELLPENSKAKDKIVGEIKIANESNPLN